MLRSRNGSAIIIVLILSIIAMSLTLFAVSISRKIVNSSELLMNKLEAKIGAKSELEKLKFYVSTGRFYSFYVKNNNFLNWPSKLYIDGRKQKIDNRTIILQDTGGLINIWSDNTNIISNILQKKGVEVSKINIIKDSILDWYDKDNFRRVNGAESEYYKEKGFKYTPRNFNGLQSIYEIHLIRGLIDNKTFNDIKNYLVLSPNWNINIDTLNVFLLSSLLNVSESTAKSLEKIKNENGILTLSDVFNTTGIRLNPQIYETSPTFVLDIKVKFRFNEAMDSISNEIDFHADNVTPYRVLKCRN